MVSHPNAVNPFPYAFLNFRSNFQLRKITLTNETFMEWEGCFDTELTVRCACLCRSPTATARNRNPASPTQAGTARHIQPSAPACGGNLQCQPPPHPPPPEAGQVQQGPVLHQLR